MPSSPWNTLSLLHDYLLDIFQISVKTSSSKQCFLTLTQLRSPCYVDIGHSVLFPLDTCPSCGPMFYFEIHLTSVFLLKLSPNSQSPHVCSSLLSILCIQQAFIVCLFNQTFLFVPNKISMNFWCCYHGIQWTKTIEVFSPHPNPHSLIIWT